MSSFDILIIGGGVFGITTAVELAERGHGVSLLNPDTIPHHLAASTDVTKVVRMEYGSDLEYFEMAELCIRRWRNWNEYFGQKLYHEVGFLMLCKASIESPTQQFEQQSLANLRAKGYEPEVLNASQLKERFPAINSDIYQAAIFNPVGGYMESGKVIDALAQYARRIGVNIYEGQTAENLVIENGRFRSVQTKEGRTFFGDHVVIAAGAHTPYLLPELQPFMKTTGHPVFFLRPQQSDLLSAPYLPVFTADISNTGWYGFPYLSDLGIIKVAKHTAGLTLHPDKDDRYVGEDEVKDLRHFLKESFPSIASSPLVYTRRCLYTDTLDGHFWIDRHPKIEGLTVSSGGSGHGMKMAPLLGEMTADRVEGKAHRFSERYNWRTLGIETKQTEEARFIEQRKLK